MAMKALTALAFAGGARGGAGGAQEAYKIGISAGLTATPQRSTGAGATASRLPRTTSIPRAALWAASSRSSPRTITRSAGGGDRLSQNDLVRQG